MTSPERPAPGRTKLAEKLTLPERSRKPRTFGITSIHDVSLSVGELRLLLDDFEGYLDLAKLGVGSAAVTPRLVEKLQLYRAAQVGVYFGGTLFEKFYSQGKIDDYCGALLELGVDIIEVSTGTVAIPLAERVELVQQLSHRFTVLAEVGSKDREAVMPPSQWIEEIGSLLDAGARYVITEGRDSATAGIFRPSGEIRTGLVHDILAHTPPERLILEAPTAASQLYFINLVGPNVNLGNVAPRDLLLLESQRVGLRSETFYVS